MKKEPIIIKDLHGQSQSPLGSNQVTLAAYNSRVDEYIKQTIATIDEHKPEVREWIDTALSNIRKDGSIFEVGSATLRDASYIRKQGYKITCSDGAINFVKDLRKRGEDAVFFNILKDEFPDTYDMIYANGVFPHFTPIETRYALNNIHKALKDNGIVAFSLKYGVGEEWINEKFEDKRFTHYWKLEDIFDLLRQEQFEIIFSNSNTGEYPSHQWLNIVAKKI